ncbi:endophilin-A3b isoform X1 [Salvelinus fontinalis]|uniref:endophilin-A3b isoform X1 n=2 Tax=Salvelinus fontinalis TaxID=8038 RepID=UPI002485E040|nr:endophilin-A3b isoform X1 [Salvelinus fontinalis]
MSVAGLKKQFHKASQLLSEKIIGAEGTKLDEEFQKMERRIDVTHKMVLELVPKTTEYLQPNPAYRAKLGMLNTVSRIRGQVKAVGYPQTEGMLGDCMLHYGRELGVGSAFGCALADIGEAMKQMAIARDSLDISVKNNFIDPLQALQDKELREIGYHLRKLEGRRLDFDYKKRRKGKIPDEEIMQAWEKFSDSKELAKRSMFDLLESDAEHVTHLSALIGAALDYHRQSYQILDSLNRSLQGRLAIASNRPKREPRPKSIKVNTINTQQNGSSHRSSVKSVISSDAQISLAVNGKNYQYTNIPLRPESPIICNHDCEVFLDQPCCRALYRFVAENEGELGFKEGDLIILTNQIDDNWYEGMISGESGFFPISYVNVLVPLPQ